MKRRLGPLAALAMLALIGAGCSGTGSSNGTNTAASSSGGNKNAATAPAQTGTGSNATNRDQAVKFAECMRHNGVKEFPDPDASGALTIDAIANGSSLDTNTAAFKQAISACKDLEPPGFTGHKRSPEQQKGALLFAQCIRDNGVKDFPDPTPDGPLIDTNRIPSVAGKDPRSALDAPMQKCRDFAAGAGVRGQ